MSLSIHTRPQGKVEIIDLSGRLTLGDATAALRAEVGKVLDRKSNILVNLAGVSYIDSAGLGQLVEGYSKATAEGRTMKLLNPHKRVDSLLHITKLNTTFETFEDEATAVASFGQ